MPGHRGFRGLEGGRVGIGQRGCQRRGHADNQAEAGRGSRRGRRTPSRTWVPAVEAGPARRGGPAMHATCPGIGNIGTRLPRPQRTYQHAEPEPRPTGTRGISRRIGSCMHRSNVDSEPLLPTLLGTGTVGGASSWFHSSLLRRLNALVKCRGSTGHLTSSRRLRNAAPAEQFTLQEDGSCVAQHHVQTTACLPFFTLGATPRRERSAARHAHRDAVQRGIARKAHKKACRPCLGEAPQQLSRSEGRSE